MEVFADVLAALSVVICVVGICGYAIALFLATFRSQRKDSAGAVLKKWFMANPAQHIGIPCSGVAAFAIVVVMLKVFMPPVTTTTPLSLTFLDLKFTGPSGPITLWLLCFLGFVIALKILRR